MRRWRVIMLRALGHSVKIGRFIYCEKQRAMFWYPLSSSRCHSPRRCRFKLWCHWNSTQEVCHDGVRTHEVSRYVKCCGELVRLFRKRLCCVCKLRRDLRIAFQEPKQRSGIATAKIMLVTQYSNSVVNKVLQGSPEASGIASNFRGEGWLPRWLISSLNIFIQIKSEMTCSERAEPRYAWRLLSKWCPCVYFDARQST